MPQFVIPDSAKPVVQFLASLPPDQRSEINKALLAIPRNSDLTDISWHLGEKLKVAPDALFGLVQFYVNLFGNTLTYGVEKTVHDFRETVQGEYPSEWMDYFEELQKVLESKDIETAFRFARGDSIQATSDHAFLTANMVTSLVPFQVSEDQLNAVLAHELKITYSHGARQDFFVVTLSEKDVKFLRLVLDQAEKFGSAIANFVRDRKMDMLTHSEQ